MSKLKNSFNKREETIKENNGIIKLDEVPGDLFDMTYKKVTPELIKYFTQRARMSPEYKSFIQFLKNFLDISKCSFFENYSMKNGYIIELHHYPFSLYDICEAVAGKKLADNGFIETYTSVEEVVILHYDFLVGLTPLNPTAHDLAHDNELKIYPKMIVGEWKKLYDMYAPFLGQTAIKKYDELMEIEKEGNKMAFPSVLKYNPIKIDVKGISKIINEKEFNNLMIDNKIKEVDKLLVCG